MRTLPEKCKDINAVPSFCGCIGGEEAVDVAAEAFCKRVAEKSGSVTGDDLVELKKALKDVEEIGPDEDDGCCEC